MYHIHTHTRLTDSHEKEETTVNSSIGIHVTRDVCPWYWTPPTNPSQLFYPCEGEGATKTFHG